MQNMRTRLHRLGTPAMDDPALLRAGEGEGVNPSFRLAANEFPIIAFPADSRWAVAAAGSARLEARLCVAPADMAIKVATDWRCLTEYADGVQALGEDDMGIGLHGDTLYLLSMHAHPNGRVLAIDLADPDASLKNAREAVPMEDSAVITGIMAARDALYIKRMRNGIDELSRVHYASGARAPVAMPIAGSLHFIGDADADGIVLSVHSWTTPAVTYTWDGKDGLQEMGIRVTSPGDYGMLASIETEAVSKDGTRVPLSIIHRKDIRLDGLPRALVEGYGSYGFSNQPRFNPYLLEWVKAGEVYAVCHVRGGGEKGEAWHRAGQGANKHKSVEDTSAVRKSWRAAATRRLHAPP